MRPDELYGMTPREFGNALEGFEELRNYNERQEWERMRLQTAALLNIHLKRKISPERLFRFEWDKGKNQPDDKWAKHAHKKFGIKGKLITSEQWQR